MTTIHYHLLSPTKNDTILVDTPVPEVSQPRVAERLLATEPTAEQVGFISPGTGGCDLSLRMAGGEFCGNASMSAAALFLSSRGLSKGDRQSVRLRVSGATGPVTVEIESLEGGLWRGTVEMPRPVTITSVNLPMDGTEAEYPIVRLPGIDHVILETMIPSGKAEQLARDWCGLLRSDAIGLMFLQEGRLTPLVYVPVPETLFWEHSCASGTTAAGAWLQEKTGAPVSLTIEEPGGPLHIEASKDSLRLSGTVRLLNSGSIAYCEPL